MHQLINILSIVLASEFVNGESDSSGDSSSGGNVISGLVAGASPKRQYLIAPRVGRSPSQGIWSSLEEATISSPGQIQPYRGYPGPLRSSLLFLVGNRRIMVPRSGGLLPQARIGRRSAPLGLMPQPRVGRSSSLTDNNKVNYLDVGGEQEVGVATLSDSSNSLFDEDFD